MTTRVLILEDDSLIENLAMELSRTDLDKVDIHFATRGKDGCEKFNRISNTLSLVVVNNAIPWGGIDRFDDCSFLKHIKTPCWCFEGQIFISNEPEDGVLEDDAERVKKIVNYIEFFMKKKTS